MSLYNDVANSLSKNSLTNSVGNGVDGITSGIGDGITQAFGGGAFGRAVSSIGTSMARNAAVGQINKYIPPNLRRAVNTGTGVIGDVLNGDFGGAGLRILDSGLLREFLPGMDGVAAQARYFGTPTPLFGGISPSEARDIYNQMRGERLCKKNLWLIEITSAVGINMSERFNMFATELEYSPLTITGEKKKVGSAHIDLVNSAEPVELRLTTMDDQQGSLKRWFKLHCAACAHSDGTVGVPAQYAIKIKIVHGFVTRESNYGGYEDIGWFRASNEDISLSRSEDNFQQLNLSFIQLDTFYPA